MQLRIIAGSLDARSPSISFRVDDGAGGLACGISRDALFDLAGHHGLRGTEEALFQALWPVIARLISAKFRARRIEADGAVLIGSADLLLHGFDETAPPARAPRSNMATERY
jgi:hypothetical protein